MESKLKLRIHGNSIRLRLSRSEVELCASQGYLRSSLDFGAMGRFDYSLETSEDFTFRCAYGSDGILVTVPRNVLNDWASSDRVEISSTIKVSEEATLQLLVEKDFQCLHKDEVDNSDSFPNPLRVEL